MPRSRDVGGKTQCRQDYGIANAIDPDLQYTLAPTNRAIVSARLGQAEDAKADRDKACHLIYC